jgi:hypothetical protein
MKSETLHCKVKLFTAWDVDAKKRRDVDAKKRSCFL